MTLEMWTVLAFLASLLALALGIIRTRRSKTKRRTYGIATAIALYPTAVYGLALAGALPLRDIGPDLLRPWVVFVLTGLSMLFIVHWRE